jgi:hypothetical protein
MNQILSERLVKANLTGEVLLNVFAHLETIMRESESGQSALTLGYTKETDDLQEGDLIPTINLVLTQYHKDT